ncbi:PEP-CTERM sorting domain-containing protein [Massilia antarctica]|uniref:PEP-CTERM sorting domain-containing protein n=1 Tax=Massilia antarctica TaxID=2765360 RepID=A0AA48WE10_9BURK|nr:PEP-CTERM sorting domain-containing protein [Massilia antarctica]QPI49859.1 PEP-CTERM sorting domain-containing protein [Massilia antarctica]
MKLLSVLLGLVLITDARADASLLGDTVDAGMYRTVDTGKGVGRIMGFGLDGPFVVENGLADQKNYSVAYTLDVDADRFAIDYRNPFAWGNGIVFRLTDLDFSNGASLQSLKVDTNMVGYGLTVGADYVEINLSGVHGTRDAYFNGQFITTAVPEPTSFAMLSLGLAVVGFGARRARKARQG